MVDDPLNTAVPRIEILGNSYINFKIYLLRVIFHDSQGTHCRYTEEFTFNSYLATDDKNQSTCTNSGVFCLVPSSLALSALITDTKTTSVSNLPSQLMINILQPNKPISFSYNGSIDKATQRKMVCENVASPSTTC